jgi:hypothetical protein
MADTSACIPSKWLAREPEPITPGFKGWLLLCAWIAGIAIFMLGAGPALLQRSALQPMAEMIEERGIEANMYFYTEVEVFYEANVNMDNTWAYPHKR